MLNSIFVDAVIYNKLTEYKAQIPVEINVKLIVKCFDRKEGTVEFIVISKADQTGKNIITKAFENIKLAKSIFYPAESSFPFVLLKLIISDTKITMYIKLNTEINAQKVSPSSFIPSHNLDIATKLMHKEFSIIMTEKRILIGFFEIIIPESPVIKRIKPSVKK